MEMHKNLTNAQIAVLFRNIGTVYEIRGFDVFHVRAYQRAADSIEKLAVPLKELWQEGKLQEIPGIGEKFQRYITELFTTGKVVHFEKLLHKEPEGLYPLLDIPGVGPKTAIKVAKKLHLEQASGALSRFRVALSNGTLNSLFSEKMKAKLLASLPRAERSNTRMLLSYANQIANDVMEYLDNSKDVIEVQALGSLRRKVGTVGDIDIAVSTKKPKEVMEYLLKFHHIKKVISKGEKMTSFLHLQGVRVDIKTSPPQSWGDMLAHYTGSKLHNIHLRSLAVQKGMSLSEWGITKNGHTYEHETEEQFYNFLKLPWISPTLREDTGEIEAAAHHALPTLVQCKEIKGDLHLHTNLVKDSSHDAGTNSIEDILKKAVDLGYEYIGFSDHNPKQSLSLEQQHRAITEYKKQIEKKAKDFASKHGKEIHVLVGMEVDILPDGTVALSDKILKELDYTIVSIHSGFGFSQDRQTQRILKALSSPYVTIFGHPTARKLLKREEIHCDWEKIFSFCCDHHILLEINAADDRLDLPDTLVRKALQHTGMQFVINTDSHAIEQMDQMEFGVWVAQRGWVENKKIVNAWNWEKLSNRVRARRMV